MRACVIVYNGSWDERPPLIEFGYNNSFHSSIQMAPFEALYGHNCRFPNYWVEVGERRRMGPSIVEEASAVLQHVRERLSTT